MKPDYTKLLALLKDQETFPFDFPVKFIGLNSAAFHLGVKTLEKAYPSMRIKTRRESSKGALLALTYAYPADNAEAIVGLLDSISKIEDVKIVL